MRSARLLGLCTVLALAIVIAWVWPRLSAVRDARSDSAGPATSSAIELAQAPATTGREPTQTSPPTATPLETELVLLDSRGQPLNAAQVVVWRDEMVLATATADDEGRTRVRSFGGTVEAVVAAQDRFPWRANFEASVGTHVLQAPEVPFVRGVAVHATTGLPAPMDLDLAFDRAPDALHDLPEQVTAALPASSLECRRRNVLVREDGTFEFAAPSGALPATLHLPVRSLLVDVHPQSVGHDTRDLRITEPLTDLRLVVFALPSIEGRVVTVDGAPVLDADVQMELEFVSPDDPSLAWQLRGSAPDFPQRDGTFHAWCGNPPAGRRHADLPKLLDPRALRRVHFDIARAGRLAGTKVTVERAAMIDTWNVGDLRLDALRRIEFVARSLDGTPIDGAVAADLSAGTPSGEDGHGWIVVDEGVTHVEVGKLGWRPVRVPLRVDSASPLEVVLEPDNVLTCVVRSQTGELRPGVQVRLKSGARPFEREDWRHTSACLGASGASQLRRARQFDDGSFEVGAQTDDRGCVAFGGLTSGIALRIDVLGPTGEPLARATTRVGVDERASVELRLVGDVTFRGRVVDEEGAPLADAFVLLRDTDGGSCGAAPSDFLGRFEIPDLVPGRATVEVQRVGFERYAENNVDLSTEAVLRLRSDPVLRATGR